jgi:hypothetical protein
MINVYLVMREVAKLNTEGPSMILEKEEEHIVVRNHSPMV